MDQIEKIRNELWNSPPHFHFWDGTSQAGGFDNNCFQFFIKLIKKQRESTPNQELKILETGAGLSTLLFLLNDLRVTSFSLNDVIEKLESYLTEKGPGLLEKWTPFSGFSEFKLPAFSEKNEAKFDIVLIDGNHAVGSVFVDYVYGNFVLKKGGMLIIDDTQLPGPEGVSKLVRSLVGDYEYIDSYRKLQAYRKISNNSLSCANMAGFKWVHSS